MEHSDQIQAHDPAAAEQPADSVGYCVLRVVIPTKKAGILIGKGGSNVKMLLEETGARVKVQDLPPSATERVLMVSAVEVEGSENCPARNALLRIQEQLVDSELILPFTVKLLMPNGQTGTLIGKGGELIKAIQDRSGAQVRVTEVHEAPPCALPEDRLVEVIGTPTTVRAGLHLVVDALRKFAVDKSVLPLFDTQKGFGQGMALYGGQQGSMMAGEPYNTYGYGGYGAQGGVGQGMGGQYGNQMPMAGQPGYPTQPGYDYGMGGYGSQHGYAQMPPQQVPPQVGAPPVSLKMRVPRAQIGGVLGRANSNLNQIRNMSGATVTVHADPNGLDHIVEISGENQQQVQAAQALTTAFMLSPSPDAGAAPAPVTSYAAPGGGYDTSGYDPQVYGRGHVGLQGGYSAADSGRGYTPQGVQPGYEPQGYGHMPGQPPPMQPGSYPMYYQQ